MAFNLSDADLKLFFDANTAAIISIFTFLVLAPFLLCLLCVLALAFAKEINLKIRLLLINIFTAEALNWFSFFILYLGWTARFMDEEDTSCQLFISLHAITGLLKFAGTSLYTVGIFVFIKHGDKKLKWYMIIPYIVVTWIVVTLTVGMPPYLRDCGTQNAKGFCTVNLFSASYIGMAVSLIVGAMFFLSMQLICCILTFTYIKQNVLEGDSLVKRAIAKILRYMVVVSVLSFISSVLPYFIAMIFENIPDRNVATFLAIVYVIRVFTNITAFPTPIVTIILLKPVRDAIKTMSKKVCLCCHKNREYPATTEEHPATSSTAVSLATTKQDSNIIGNYMATDQKPTSRDQNPATTDQGLLDRSGCYTSSYY